jgi:putative exporter of polyketide antibiotics
LTLLAYKKYKAEEQQLSEESGNFSDYTKGKQLFQAIGISIVTIIAILFTIVLVIKFYQKKKNNQ